KMVRVLTILTRLTRIQKGRDFPCKISRLKAVFERLWGDEKSSPALLWFLTGRQARAFPPVTRRTARRRVTDVVDEVFQISRLPPVDRPAQ
ncbi:hypothetical protein ACTX1N_22225, partial [Pseudomonas aeruginosa]